MMNMNIYNDDDDEILLNYESIQQLPTQDLKLPVTSAGGLQILTAKKTFSITA